MTDDGHSVVLLTGATGAIGRELLLRMVQQPRVRVVCLVRANSDDEAARRLSATLDEIPGNPFSAEQRSRIVALRGDITQPLLGLDLERWKALASELTRIVHGAASVSWSLPLEAARRINVGGTQEMLRLAEAAAASGSLRAFDYLSTVMVGGRRRGIIPEQELDASAGFWSTYEQSKCEAEACVWKLKSRLPVAVFRLSMVVGDSRTGYTSAFNVMYWPLKMLARGIFWIVPADPGGIVDLVPVDFAADAVEAISGDKRNRGKCFHIAAGPECCCTISELLEMAAETLHVRKPLLVNPTAFLACVRPFLYAVTWGKRREMLNKGRVYVPYLSYRARFDVTQTSAALKPFGLQPPPVRTYFRKLIDYAVATDWGKRPQPASSAGAGARSA